MGVMWELLFSVFCKVIFVFVVVKTKNNTDITCRLGRVTPVNVFLLEAHLCTTSKCVIKQMGRLPPEVELKGRVGVLLKVSLGLELLPHFNYVLQQGPVFLLLAVSQLPSVPVIFRGKTQREKLWC